MPSKVQSVPPRKARPAKRPAKRPSFTLKKSDILAPEGLCVRTTPRCGRGVFALRAFAADETIEVSPVILIPDKQFHAMNKTELKDYHFKWGNGYTALALGFGSIYNHSHDPNAEFLCHPATRSIRFTAARPIAAGEEIRIDYECELWFKVR